MVYLGNTTSYDNLLVGPETLVDLVFKVFFSRVLHCARVEEPNMGTLFIFSYSVALK